MSEWILLQSGILVYSTLFLCLMGGAIGLPIPEDITLILGGILAHRDKAQLELVLLVCYIGSVFGDIFIFLAGRKLGSSIYDKGWFKTRLNRAHFDQIKIGLERRSLITIFSARHIFYLRTVTFLICGALNMSLRRFIIVDALSALISVPLVVGVGYLGSEHYQMILALMRKMKIFFLATSVLIVTMGLLLYWRRRSVHSIEESSSEGLS